MPQADEWGVSTRAGAVHAVAWLVHAGNRGFFRSASPSYGLRNDKHCPDVKNGCPAPCCDGELGEFVVDEEDVAAPADDDYDDNATVADDDDEY